VRKKPAEKAQRRVSSGRKNRWGALRVALWLRLVADQRARGGSSRFAWFASKSEQISRALSCVTRLGRGYADKLAEGRLRCRWIFLET